MVSVLINKKMPNKKCKRQSPALIPYPPNPHVHSIPSVSIAHECLFPQETEIISTPANLLIRSGLKTLSKVICNNKFEEMNKFPSRANGKIKTYFSSFFERFPFWSISYLSVFWVPHHVNMVVSAHRSRGGLRKKQTNSKVYPMSRKSTNVVTMALKLEPHDTLVTSGTSIRLNTVVVLEIPSCPQSLRPLEKHEPSTP